MKVTDEHIDVVKQKFVAIADCLTEKGRRLWSAAEALSYGHGGVLLVSRATNISRTTIYQGIKEIQHGSLPSKRGVRLCGGGRKNLKTTQPDLVESLNSLVEPTSRGDPESPLRWTCKSTRKLAQELSVKGHHVSHMTVATLLRELDYSLQANKKTLEGSQHEDRDAQFNYINTSVLSLQKNNQPTISVDTKKKELIGEYKNQGKEFHKKGQPTKVNTLDFPDKRLGKVAPYGIYDIGQNKGWVSVGISADTAEFAVNSIRTWWYKMGSSVYSSATELLITADCGGSNGNRVRLWKYELQKLSDEINLKIHVRHFPPGTSKWNKIEHRLFSYITKNWRGRPLISRETVVNLIANTKTDAGLEVRATLDENAYQKGRKISNEELASLNVQGDIFHPEWNYTLSPRS
jgi:hypothetical protein